jgi:hypothetical protein
MLEFSRDLLIAATCFQSEYLERPNAKVNGRPLGRAQAMPCVGVPVERQVRPWREVALDENNQPDGP